MEAYVYILFSKKLNRYYVGSTGLNPHERLTLHLSKNYGADKFTAKASDWIISLSFECSDITQARKCERYIKGMKSRSFIESLKGNAQKIEWLLNKC